MARAGMPLRRNAPLATLGTFRSQNEDLPELADSFGRRLVQREAP